ncbi:MAG: (deoxy)nucleoside triphosphate pyrophosphohydrolase [Planctomycetota bacterium]
MSEAAPNERLRVVAGAIRSGRGFLLGRRPEDSGGYWEFPGGKIEGDELPEGALAREIREELDIDVQVGRWIASVDITVDGREISLSLYHCRHTSGLPRTKFHRSLRIVEMHGFDDLELGVADREILGLAREALAEALNDPGR